MRGQTALVYGLVAIFIFALIGLALLPSLANSSALAAANNNVTASAGASAIVNLSPTILATVIILSILGVGLGGYAAMRR